MTRNRITNLIALCALPVIATVILRNPAAHGDYEILKAKCVENTNICDSCSVIFKGVPPAPPDFMPKIECYAFKCSSGSVTQTFCNHTGDAGDTCVTDPSSYSETCGSCTRWKCSVAKVAEGDYDCQAEVNCRCPENGGMAHTGTLRAPCTPP